MRENSKFYMLLLLFLLIIMPFTSYSTDYYICLGSFFDINNSIEYSNSLNKNGIDTISEKAFVNGKYFNRVLYNKKYGDFNFAKKDIAKLLNNLIIREANIRDLWIRSGALKNSNVSYKTGSQESIKVIEKKEVKDAVALNKSKDIEENIIQEEKKDGKEVKKSEDIKESIDDLTPPVKKNGSYKIIDEEGYANCIFASDPIELGKEDNYQLKVIFIKPDKVYARCYLPGPVGEVKAGDFWHEIWIDDKLVMRTGFNEPPESNLDQIQIWITEDEYKTQMEELEKGEHIVVIWIMKNDYRENKAVA